MSLEVCKQRVGRGIEAPGKGPISKSTTVMRHRTSWFYSRTRGGHGSNIRLRSSAVQGAQAPSRQTVYLHQGCGKLGWAKRTQKDLSHRPPPPGRTVPPLINSTLNWVPMMMNQRLNPCPPGVHSFVGIRTNISLQRGPFIHYQWECQRCNPSAGQPDNVCLSYNYTSQEPDDPLLEN